MLATQRHARDVAGEKADGEVIGKMFDKLQLVADEKRSG